MRKKTSKVIEITIGFPIQTKKKWCFLNMCFFLYRKSYSNFDDFWWFSKNLVVFFHASRLHVSCCKIKTNKSFSKNFDPGERYDVPLSIARTHNLWKWTAALGTRETWAWCKYSILLASKTSVQVHLHMIASMYSVTGTPSLVQYVTAGGHFYVEGDTSSQGYSRWPRMVPRVCLDIERAG